MHVCKSERLNTKDQSLKTGKGFTLIELSIVIVIIGLIVAGVVGGQALVKQAKLRSITSEFNKIQLAINAFRLEYNALPGDMNNAHSYWGNSCHTDSNICNGDGNNRLATWNTDEAFMFWKHLSLAGILDGNYSGESLGNPDPFEGNINTMESDYNGALYHINGASYYMNNWIGLYVSLGAKRQNDRPVVAMLTPKEAFNIDKKVDDGKPGLGKYWNGRSYLGYNTGAWAWNNCISSADESGEYLINISIKGCRMLYYLD